MFLWKFENKQCLNKFETNLKTKGKDKQEEEMDHGLRVLALEENLGSILPIQ